MAIDDGAVILLSGWIIYLFLRLRAMIQRLAPVDQQSAVGVSPQTQSPELLQNGSDWITWVSAGLGMECIWNILGFVISVLTLYTSLLGSPTRSSQFGTTSRSDALAVVSLSMVLFTRAPRIIFIWWMTRPAPAETNHQNVEQNSVDRRMWLRFFAVASVAGALVSSIYEFHRISPGESIRWIQIVVDSCLGSWFFLFIEKDLAPLIGNEDIRRLAALMKWLVPGIGNIALECIRYGSSYGWIDGGYTSDLQAARHLIFLGLVPSTVWSLYACWRSFRQALRASTPPIVTDVI